MTLIGERRTAFSKRNRIAMPKRAEPRFAQDSDRDHAIDRRLGRTVGLMLGSDIETR
jgi:hypothetical protein